jgi:hypothetical protein|mmetsp:Transcript_26686/g.42332  ORF Transcript_26686/g.42332 Transcript_26686/m.42332 type:complete len:138 (+) Transcript_26686:579-992(+)
MPNGMIVSYEHKALEETWRQLPMLRPWAASKWSKEEAKLGAQGGQKGWARPTSRQHREARFTRGFLILQIDGPCRPVICFCMTIWAWGITISLQPITEEVRFEFIKGACVHVQLLLSPPTGFMQTPSLRDPATMFSQ